MKLPTAILHSGSNNPINRDAFSYRNSTTIKLFNFVAERRRGGISSRSGRVEREIRETKSSVRSKEQKIVPVFTKNQEQHNILFDNKIEEIPKKKLE